MKVESKMVNLQQISIFNADGIAQHVDENGEGGKRNEVGIQIWLQWVSPKKQLLILTVASTASFRKTENLLHSVDFHSLPPN